MTRSLSTALGVKYCFATECLDSPPTRVRTLAFWTGQELGPNIEYSLLSTPCERVLAGMSCTYGKDIQTLFPDDQDLVELGAESYAAVPLLGSRGAVLGHLVILDQRPFSEPAPDLALLELFAARAAAELERQRANTELANSEARLRQVIDLVPHFIFAKDTEGRFILANRAVATAYGTSVEDLIGKSDGDFAVSEDEAQGFRHDDLEVIQSGKIKVIPEESITDSQGAERILQTTKIPFRFANSNLPAVLGVSTDITEQRRAERTLRAILEGTSATVGEAFFRSLTRHLAKALDTRYAVVAEFAGDKVRTKAVWANDQFLDSFEYPLGGSPCEQVAESRATTYFRQGLQQLFPDHFLPADLGAESYLGTPVFDVERRPIGLLAVLDHRPMANSEQNSQLLSIFAARAAAEIERERLEEYHRKLHSQVLHVQKLESLGVLAGGIAHDFNNLLCAILGNVDLAMVRLDDPTPDRLQKHLEEIATAAKRSAELANQMLAYSGRGSFVVTHIDLNGLVEEMLDLLSVSISKKARIHLDLDRHLPLFEGDATQIRQIVMNLVTNASDAIGEVPGEIHIRSGSRQADRAYLDEAYLAEQLPEGDYLFLEVEDNGSGMDEITQARLFDPFFTTKTTGRGLGLAALLGIVRGHHGAARVRSSPGEGSVFRILLPTSSKAPTKATTAAVTSSTRWSGAGKILLVDDEELVRLATGQMLEHLGFAVELAADGRRAIGIFGQDPQAYCAVVLDMMMPELDGMETARELRRLAPGIKILLASGFTRQEISSPLLGDEGVDAFLQKPVRLAQLESKLREILTN